MKNVTLTDIQTLLNTGLAVQLESVKQLIYASESRLEASIIQKLSEKLEAKIDAKIDSKIDGLRQEMLEGLQFIGDQIARFNEVTDGHEGRIAVLEKHCKQYKTFVSKS